MEKKNKTTSVKELKRKFSLLLETNYLRHPTQRLTYKKLERLINGWHFEEFDFRYNKFLKMYEYDLEIYILNFDRFNKLQKHLSCELPKYWLHYIGNPNYFELTKTNKKLFNEKLQSGFYKIKYYNIKFEPIVIELVNLMPGFETYDEYQKRIGEELKIEMQKVGKQLKEMGL
jgi:hypothetical protein